MKNNDRIVIIGAGASGLMAAGRASQLGKKVVLLEKMDNPGRKILMSGNARCNLTNSHSLEEFIPMYGQNGHFLYGTFKRFFRPELLQLLQKYGVATSQEPDGRIFPSSNRSADVLHALRKFDTESGATLIADARATGLSQQNGKVTGVTTDSDFYPASAVILATGGASYPQTGSAGDGYELARSAGHKIIKLRPALVPLVFKKKKLAEALQGISLPSARLTSFSFPASEIRDIAVPRRDTGRGLSGKKPKFPVIESRCGSVVFTHYGMSGPAVLLMSLSVARALEESSVSISIDFMPDNTAEQLDANLQELFTMHGSRTIRNILIGLIAERIANFVLEHAEIEPAVKACRISSQQRRSITSVIKSLRIDIAGTRPLGEAMVTSGGVCLDEIDPRTLQSKLIKGLYFCGEVIDIDADTGGYNLQAAFSTGFLAGESAASL